MPDQEQRRVAALRMRELLGSWPSGAGPAHHRLAAGLRALILDGRLPLETRLAPERSLATALGVSRKTVTAAYDRLRGEGYLRSRQGSGTMTTLPVRERFDGDTLLGPGVRFDLTVAALEAPPQLGQMVQEAAGDLGSWLNHHGYNPLGLQPLREAVAVRFTARGLPTRPGQVLITNGALQAIHLLATVLAVPGRPVAVEIPTYPAALDIFIAARARVAPFPVTIDGWDIDQFRSTLARSRPTLAYLIPEFQNPTGALMDEATRQAVAEAVQASGALLVADETNVDLSLTSPPIALAPLRTEDGHRTLHVGSMSKSFWGGLRIGWVRGDERMIQRLARARAATDMASPVLDQLVAVRLLSHADEVLADRRRRVVDGRTALAAALRRELPAWRAPLPPGGLWTWAQLPAPGASALAGRAREFGVAITPGPRFAVNGATLEQFVRLPFAATPSFIDEAVATLARVVAIMSTAGGETQRRPSDGTEHPPVDFVA